LDSFAGGMAITQSVIGTVSSVEEVPPTEILGRDAVQEFLTGPQSPPGEIVTVESTAQRAGGIGFNPLVAFGATQAIFFALFTANANASSIMEEERDGTFVRLLATPTRKLTLLGGKLFSTIIMVVVQLVLLFLAFTFIGSLLEGSLVFIWGTKVGLIALLIALTAFAASGLGAVIASSAKTPEQAGVIGMVINMFMAVTGGAFGFRFASWIRYASAVFWGADAFEELAGGGSDIWLNITVLGGFGVVAFFVALPLLGRRFNR
jgi:ABC-2 type transport system permease protein